jgi:hypothetical protein
MTICIVIISAGVALLMMPLLRYIVVGWRAKRKDIMDGLNADARLAYFEMFSRAEPRPSAAKASAEFERLYARWYGRRFFVAPSLLLLLVGVIEITLVIFTVLQRRGHISNPFFDVPDTAIAAIAGAYMWTVNDFISRARRLDFSPSDILWGALRLIIAVPMGYAFAVIAPPVDRFIAFAIGAFPLAKVTTMLQQLANKNLNLEATAQEAKEDIIKLQGINKTIVERLANEDITAVTQVAYCDPVQLIMRSNLTFNFVTDCMNQALAWMYLEDDLSKIRPLGMRGAAEIRDLITEYDDASTHDVDRKAAHDQAVAAFPKIASALKQDPETLQIVFRQIAEDPYTIFLSRVW